MSAGGWRFCGWTVPRGTAELSCGRPAVAVRRVPARVVGERHDPSYEMGLCADHVEEFDRVETAGPPRE